MIMTMNEMQLFLIEELLNESKEYKDMKIPNDEGVQNKLFRTLVNIRPPMAASPEFIRVQDIYLQGISREKGIADVNNLEHIPGNHKIYLWQGDITRLKADAVVNAANSRMLGCFVPCHGCIDNAIHTFAGVQLRYECAEIMKRQKYPEPPGSAKITGAYNLPAGSVIHTVGPVIHGALTEKDCSLLSRCYSSCLEQAEENGLKSLAFCCISTGEFHFPNEKAAEIAVETVMAFLKKSKNIEKVIFNVFKDRDREIYERLLGVSSGDKRVSSFGR